jgi:hypothetical protein
LSGKTDDSTQRAELDEGGVCVLAERGTSGLILQRPYRRQRRHCRHLEQRLRALRDRLGGAPLG